MRALTSLGKREASSVHGKTLFVFHSGDSLLTRCFNHTDVNNDVFKLGDLYLICFNKYRSHGSESSLEASKIRYVTYDMGMRILFNSIYCSV